MNKKAEVFKRYLDDKKITCFVIDEIPDDQLNTVVFRSYIEIEGQQLSTIIALDSSVYGIIRVKIADRVLNDENETDLYKQLNKLNRQYKVFKYYFTEDGSLFLDSCLLHRNGEADGDMIYVVLDVIIKHLTAEYKNLMKLIWG